MVALLVGGVLSWTDTTRVADRRAGPPGQFRSSPRQLPVIVESVGSRKTHRSFLARPSIRARAGILIELSTGAVLFEKHPDQPRPIASLTKIMTALLVLERDPHLSGTVPISPRAARQDPIDVGLAMGKRVKVRDLMYGLLLRSGNDAAVALAEYVSGSVPRFIHLMNARARELGLEHTRFATPNGLSDKGYSTAREVAILARAALQDERFAELVRTKRYTIHSRAVTVRRLRNLNGLLTSFPGTFGVKTGYTHAAGECVAAAARRGGEELLAVVLGDPVVPNWRAAYGDAATLLDYGFALSKVRRSAPQ